VIEREEMHRDDDKVGLKEIDIAGIFLKVAMRLPIDEIGVKERIDVVDSGGAARIVFTKSSDIIPRKKESDCSNMKVNGTHRIPMSITSLLIFLF
jgi:hypothetical protein